ncbi:MAG: YidC/Oxa1 family insertase periplasmic-domain containing protein [Blastocatellia bacterium]
MDRTRVILAMVLSMAVLMAWPVVMRRFFPAPPPSNLELIDQPNAQPQAADSVAKPQSPQAPARAPKVPSQAPAQIPPTQGAQREPITIKTEYWTAKLSNHGAIATSWILTSYPDGSAVREIRPAEGEHLELIPQDIPDSLAAPFSLQLPWSPDLSRELSEANFQVEGLGPNENEIDLGQAGAQKEITFVYSSPAVTARKTFKFTGGSFVFDVRAEAEANGTQQPVEIVIGPRIGDQSDRQTGSYALPPQIVAYSLDGKNHQIHGASITPPFATVTGVDHSSNQIEIDKPLAGDVDQVKLVADKGATFLGYARVTGRESGSQRLTLDALPQGMVQGVGVAQGFDTLRQGYQWAGVSDHYFAMLAVSEMPIPEIRLTNVQLKSPGHDAPQDYPSLAVPVRASSNIHVFVGPKDRQLLAEISNQMGANLSALIDYGMFGFLVRPVIPALAWALNGLKRLFNNYGWAIVVVTVLINLTLSPLRFYSSKKMKKAAKHQPRMKELQDKMKKLKENPKKYERELQELQQEQLALMKEANPLGGCMPLLLQMPIFWAVYLYLSSSLDVRHAPWMLWIHDLSRPDPYKLLPIIMCVTMIASTKLTPQPPSADPSMKMQRIMMIWLMPIMLTYFFFFSAPSGLVLYWMVSNIVGVAIQLLINRWTTEPTNETALAGPSGESKGGPRGATKTSTDAAAKKSRKRQGRRAEV